MSESLVKVLDSSGISRVAPSIGIPIVLPDGNTILRGPRINVPELLLDTARKSAMTVQRREK